MRKVYRLTNRIAAMLLSGMLVVGSVPGTVLASDIQTDIGQTSEIAAEEIIEMPSEDISEEGSVEGKIDVGEISTEEYSGDATAQKEEAASSYTITLDANGGFFENEWDDAVGDYVEQAITVTKQIPVGGNVVSFPVYTDQNGKTMVFAGWSLERDGELITTGYEEYAPADNCVLYAAWLVDEASIDDFAAEQEEIPGQYYTVTLDANGGYFSNEWDDAIGEIVEYAEAVEKHIPVGEAVLALPVLINQDGQSMHFAGWSLEKDGNLITEGDEEYIPVENCTLYAVWETVDKFVGVNDDQNEIFTDEYADPTDSYQESKDIETVTKTDVESEDTETVTETDVESEDTEAEKGTETAQEMMEESEQDMFDDSVDEHVEETGITASEPLIDNTEETSSEKLSSVFGLWTEVTLNANGGYFQEEEWDDEKCEYFYVKKEIVDLDDVSYSIDDENGILHWILPPKADDELAQKFLGWGINNSSTVDLPSADNEEFDFSPDEDVVLYAIWGPRYTPLDVPETGVCGLNLSWVLDTEGTLTISGTGDMMGTTDSEDDDYEDMPWKKYADMTKKVVIEEGVTSVSGKAFEGFNLIEDVYLPESLTDIGYSAFYECGSLTSIRIPDGVIHIRANAFRNCKNLQSAYISKNVREIQSHAFEQCENLKYIDLPDSLAQVDLGADVFRYTEWQESMGDFPVYDGLLLRYQGDPTTSSGTVVIPDSVTRIGTFAFEDTYSITKIVLPEGLTRIENSAFEWCFGLEEINIPSTVIYIGKNAFDECASLKSIVIPESITEIQSGTFYYCSNLKSVTIPSSVTSIGDWAFEEGSEDLVIFGVIGSFAQQYANDNNIKFCDINAISIADADISIPNQTYTGKALTPKPTVKMGDKNLVANIDYTVAYSNNTNAGTAKVTITGQGKYSSKKTVTFQINKAAQSITAKAAASSVAVGKTTTVSVTGAKGAKSFKSSNAAIAAVTSAGKITAKKIGTVKITATSAATANYKAASKTVTINVVPVATTSLTAANQVTGIKLFWKKVAGANGYKIYRGKTLIKTITSGSTVTYIDKKANTNGAKYVYKLVAKASSGDSTLSKARGIYRVARTTISSLKNSSSKKMTVRWYKNAKGNGYQIQYSRSKTFASGNKTVTVAGASTVSKVIASLTKGKTYYVRVRAYKTVNKVKYFSSWSASKSVKIRK